MAIHHLHRHLISLANHEGKRTKSCRPMLIKVKRSVPSEVVGVNHSMYNKK